MQSSRRGQVRGSIGWCREAMIPLYKQSEKELQKLLGYQDKVSGMKV
jgi:hypothetical protein